MKDIFFSGIGIVLVVGSFYIVLREPAPLKYQPENTYSYIKIDSNIIKVEIAYTDTEREKGLSDKLSLPNKQGLLFVFGESGNHGFWMKDMNFPIDIVWIDGLWRVAGVERGASPKSFPKIFYPPRAIKYVLELNSGEASTLGIDTGSQLYFEGQN